MGEKRRIYAEEERKKIEKEKIDARGRPGSRRVIRPEDLNWKEASQRLYDHHRENEAKLGELAQRRELEERQKIENTRHRKPVEGGNRDVSATVSRLHEDAK